MGRNFKDQGVLATLVGAPLDYNKQPLPLIGVWGNYNNSTYGFTVYDSDLLTVNQLSSSGYNVLGTMEFGGNGQLTTSNGSYQQISSATPTSYQFGVKATMSHGADGNGYFWGGPDAAFGGKSTQIMNQFAYFGVVIGPEGYRQNFSLYQAGLTFRQQIKGGFLWLDAYTVTASDATLVNLTSTVTGVGGGSAAVVNSGAGMIAYHRPLNKLCWIEGRDTSGSTYRMHVWKNPNRKLTGKVGELRSFIQEAKAGINGASYTYYDYTMPGTPSGVPEATVRCRLIPSNDDTRYTVSRFWPSSFVETQVLTVSGANAITVSARQTSATVTTSYGCENGGVYGIRHQISWDNKWVFVFSAYYYYGCGMVGYFINLDDPTLTYTLSFTDSTDGMQVYPWNKSGFIFGRSASNSDGPGLYTARFDPASGLNADFATPISNQGALSLSFNAFQFDTGYTSTNYPCLVPVERWFYPAGGVANG